MTDDGRAYFALTGLAVTGVDLTQGVVASSRLRLLLFVRYALGWTILAFQARAFELFIIYAPLLIALDDLGSK